MFPSQSALSPLTKSLLFSLPWKIWVSQLEASLLFSLSVSMDCRLVVLYFMLISTYEWVHNHVCLSGFGLSHSGRYFFFSLHSFACQFHDIIFNSWVVLHYVNVPHFIKLFFGWETCRLFLGSGYYEQCCYEYSWASVLVVWLSILWVYAQEWYSWVMK